MNNKINEYQEKPEKKPMEQWIAEAKKHLAELQSMRKKIEQSDENK